MHQALGGVGSGGMKFMVIESHIPPKYHKVMASYPKTVLQYDVNDLNPTISFTNREKALATYVISRHHDSFH